MDKGNIILVGFMGCGKTTIGRLLAERLGWVFIDTDTRIEEEQGCTIKEIFAVKGEDEFRKIEREAIASMSLRNHQIIATGGGVVKDPVNVQNLKKSGTVIYLRLTPESVYERVKEDHSRPLLQPYTGEQKLERIRTLMEERRPLYENAGDRIIDCDGLSPLQIFNIILKKDGCFLKK